MPPLDLTLQILVAGLLLGGIYALAALGLSLVFGIMDVVNLAHGHMLMIGAYIAILLFADMGITPLLGMFVAMAALFVVGAALQKVLLERIVDEGIEQPIIVLFGLALVLQSLGRIVLTSDARLSDIGIPGQSFTVGPVDVALPLVGTLFEVPSFLVPFKRSVTFVVALVLIFATWAFLEYTRTGLAIRATAQNRPAARYMGIDTDRIYVVTLGIGTALAGAAGALLSMLFPITPFVGWEYLLKAFTVVVLGGVGSILGTLVGGLILGVSENLGDLYLPIPPDIIGYSIFLLVLLVRPRGLFGTGGEE